MAACVEIVEIHRVVLGLPHVRRLEPLLPVLELQHQDSAVSQQHPVDALLQPQEVVLKQPPPLRWGRCQRRVQNARLRLPGMALG